MDDHNTKVGFTVVNADKPEEDHQYVIIRYKCGYEDHLIIEKKKENE